MATHDVELPGSLSLVKQSRALEGAEATGRKFVDARLWVNAQNKVSNLVTFELLTEEPDPPLGVPVLKRKLAAGEASVWSGQMIVDGTAEPQVFLVRRDAP